jgi:hypothetical protein
MVLVWRPVFATDLTCVAETLVCARTSRSNIRFLPLPEGRLFELSVHPESTVLDECCVRRVEATESTVDDWEADVEEEDSVEDDSDSEPFERARCLCPGACDAIVAAFSGFRLEVALGAGGCGRLPGLGLVGIVFETWVSAGAEWSDWTR